MILVTFWLFILFEAFGLVNRLGVFLRKLGVAESASDALAQLIIMSVSLVLNGIYLYAVWLIANRCLT